VHYNFPRNTRDIYVVSLRILHFGAVLNKEIYTERQAVGTERLMLTTLQGIFKREGTHTYIHIYMYIYDIIYFHIPWNTFNY